jgi:predicted flap endonuclease-1-like 5' DNA nuclease
MWDVLLRRWLDLLFWWAPRKQQPPGAEPARRDRAAEAPTRPTETGGRPAPSQPARRPAQAKGGAARPGARPAAKPAPKEPEKPVAAPVPDDLTQIKGIGPAMQNRLRSLGITTFADLAAADPDQLMSKLKGSQPLSLGRVRHWTEAARERART